jgi:hypothetical protein
MSFADDVNATEGLAGEHRRGLRALRNRDRAQIRQRRGTRLSGSVDIDAALASRHPGAHRWDYVIGQRRSANQHDLLHWVEVHPASSDGNVGEVMRKGFWLMHWLRTTPLAAYPRRLLWVASGRSAFNARAPQLKALASTGIQFVG